MALNPKVLSVSRVEYHCPHHGPAMNKSGCMPVGDRVLILPDHRHDEIAGQHRSA
jgi:hypothetical protein